MPSKKEFILIFKADAAERLDALEKGIVKLEKAPGDMDLIKDLNREAHTLKGSSRVFGFNAIQEIAHKIEDVLEQIGAKQVKLDKNIGDSILSALDVIRNALATITEEGETGIDAQEVCNAITESIFPASQKKAQKKTSPPKAAKKTGQKRSESTKKEPLDISEKQAEEEQEEKELSRGSKIISSEQGEYIRVPLDRVNKLLNLVGEMVINKMKTSAKVSHIKSIAKLTKDSQKLASYLGEKVKTVISNEDHDLVRGISECNAHMQKLREETTALYDNITTESFQLDPVIDELQARMKEIRMLPCAVIFERFPRMIRDIAGAGNKKVDIEISGEETELDKKVLDEVKASLMHILRNSVDHGIELPDERKALGKPETGIIKLSAVHESGNVVITVEDDGKGIDIDDIKKAVLDKRLVSQEEVEQMLDEEVMNLIFMNSYSTSPIITDVSGRGIGLDVVRQDIDRLKGQITVESVKNEGTRFILTLPLTIAIIQVLILNEGGMMFAVPMTSIVETLKVAQEDISTIEGKMAIQVRDHTVPVVDLRDVLGLSRDPAEKGENRPAGKRQDEAQVIIVSSMKKKVGFIVEDIAGEEEVFIKSLGGHLGKINNVSGATILGTGEVIVILDVADLIANSAMSHPAVAVKKAIPAAKKQGKRILVVEDALPTRELEKSILETEGYAVDTAVDGLDGLDKLTQGEYDLIVADVQMPRMDGFEFCRSIKSNDAYKDIPVVIVTALEKEEDKRKGIEVGAQAYIVKTAFEQSNLLDTIERLIG